MVKNKLAEEDVQRYGWLLDGYPRSGEQAEAIEKEGIRPDVFLLINVRPRGGLGAPPCSAPCARGCLGGVAGWAAVVARARARAVLLSRS